MVEVVFPSQINLISLKIMKNCPIKNESLFACPCLFINNFINFNLKLLFLPHKSY